MQLTLFFIVVLYKLQKNTHNTHLFERKSKPTRYEISHEGQVDNDSKNEQKKYLVVCDWGKMGTRSFNVKVTHEILRASVIDKSPKKRKILHENA